MQNRWSKEEYLNRVDAELLFEKQHWLLLFGSVLVGCIGLNLNSIPMILGAKLLSPLMPAIIGMGVGLSWLNLSLFRRALRILVLQVLAAICLATIYFWLTPLKAAGSELTGQASPNLWNILISLVGGLVGAVGVRRKERNHIAAGVALATSLVPPLCTTGYGIATGQLTFVSGSLYLFAINIFFIMLGHYLVARFMKDSIPKSPQVFGVYALLAVLILWLVLPAKKESDKRVLTEAAQTFVTREFSQQIVLNQSLDMEKQELEVVVTGPALTEADIRKLEQKQNAYGLQQVRLVVQQVGSPTTNDEEGLNKRIADLIDQQMAENNTATD
ncbi:DUF389 domain-containing protein [Streptococcus sp. NLN76]|uniref:DUF389 domain-containing protein n=1 Tax=Streptococcus sp. NLN76 TaxID=2822800 RepID=UPI0018AB4E21|nr:DUF389 domain-containing protein [Streptococcus sp. NLN76]MBF8970999.1 DUF389 domain-containing protein [Streptococcus sp. NLN76]